MLQQLLDLQTSMNSRIKTMENNFSKFDSQFSAIDDKISAINHRDSLEHDVHGIEFTDEAHDGLKETFIKDKEEVKEFAYSLRKMQMMLDFLKMKKI